MKSLFKKYYYPKMKSIVYIKIKDRVAIRKLN